MTEPIRVLQVEDSEGDAALVVRALSKTGAELEARRVETADELRAALAARRWDVVLSDFQMPQLDAEAALEIVRATDPDLPFIVVSGAVGEETAVRLMRAGAQDYVMKDRLLRLAPVVERECLEARNRRERRRAEQELLGARQLAQEREAQNQALLAVAAERQLAEQALRRAKEQAESANRTKTEFLATLSHELRTPLSVVLGFTQLLRSTELTAEQREFVALIDRSGNSLLQQINDLLDLSKIEAGRMDLEAIPFDLRTVCQEVVALLSPKAAEKQLSLGLDFALPTNTPLLGDPARVRQVLLNLADNALKFTEHGGVCIEVRPQGEGGLRLSVIDTGIGIEPGTQPLLFSKFTQADSSTTRRYGGTGLGLAISKRLVELMGGKIGVLSEPGKGSRFWFTLASSQASPIAPTAPEVETQVSAPLAVEAVVAAPLRVLVAEDDPTNQRVVSLFLQKLGCEVDWANNGREAVARFRAQTYDVVLMDCYMPEMDGFEATAEIRRAATSGKRVPIIALSASAMDEDRRKCVAAGMDEFMTKPIIVEQLRSALAKWAGR